MTMRDGKQLEVGQSVGADVEMRHPKAKVVKIWPGKVQKPVTVVPVQGAYYRQGPMCGIGPSLWSEQKFDPTDSLSRRHWYQNAAFLVPFNFYKGHILGY